MSVSPTLKCVICNHFQGRWPIDGRENDHSAQGIRSHIVPSFTWNDLLHSAGTCYCCEILVEGCSKCFDHHRISIDNIEDCSLRFYYPPHIEDVDEADCDKHLVFHLHNGNKFEVEAFATDDEDCHIPDAWDYFPTLQRTSPATDSAEALATVKTWISDCKDTHSDSFCHFSEIPQLPKRVVDVGLDQSSVRLVETNGLRSQYLCLSHCWGPTQIITSLTENLEAHKRQISWEQLSKTFQEAITLTRRLGFHYIWIDSLCIIQNSATDWEIESAKMADIYSLSHLTIAATRSPNGAGGLFTSTPDVAVQGKTPAGDDYRFFFRQRIVHQLDAEMETAGFIGTEKHFPLLSRAWVYQERMLSPRVLHFGHYEIFFECKSSVACECDGITFHGSGTETAAPLVKIDYADMLEELTAAHHGIDDHAIDSRHILQSQHHVARLWRTLVTCYTALKLTMSKDRLPAIAGVARQMAAARQSPYLAGLWQDSLSDDLLWMVYAHSTFLKPRPHLRTAPTWSWASVEAVVWYGDVLTFGAIDERVSVERTARKEYSTVHQCRVEKATVDEYGMVKSGELTMSGPLTDSVLEQEMGEHEGRDIVLHYVAFPSGRRVRLKADYLLAWAGPYQALPGTKVLCLLKCTITEGTEKYSVALVLKQSIQSPGRMERIGCLKISGNHDELSAVNAKTETVVVI
ncbi:HET-domain-containing protein [Sporormia fimetaria CBS 119925]|uniref:HET-domain-containing protein n=1 Tax=Sporormia fimetaria CBS 119925 TaxID=1340428 RepID=A0A6A6VP59_9PLEO|nr:HET-domain-containing protein [Sporormia fimetaria CBS 119925]